MPNSITSEIEYFFHEGKENINDCLRLAFEAAVRRSVSTIVIFTGIGVGPKLAVEQFQSRSEYSKIKIIAVTFPHGQKFAGLNPEDTQMPKEYKEFFLEHHVPVVRAHLPFNPIHPHLEGHDVPGQGLTLISHALNIFCGSMSLCVQAALMACDAGEIELGEHVIALTSDTAILVRSAPTERFLADFVVREILCKPMSLTIIKGEARLMAPATQLTLEGVVDQIQKAQGDEVISKEDHLQS